MKQTEPVVIHWQDFKGLHDDDELLLDLLGPLMFRRAGVVYVVDDLAPRRETKRPPPRS